MAAISTAGDPDRSHRPKQGRNRHREAERGRSGGSPCRGAIGGPPAASGGSQPTGKDLRRGANPQDLPRPTVEPVFHCLHLRGGHLAEVCPFREVRAHPAVGVLVPAPFPGMVGGGKAAVHIELLCDLPMSRELLAVVCRAGVNPVPDRTQTPGDRVPPACRSARTYW